MTSRKLVTSALAGFPVLRVPVGPLVVHFCARAAGYTLREYTTSAQVLADSVIRYYERFKPDAVWVSADTWVSAEAMGARVGATDDNQPFGGFGKPLVRTAADIARMRGCGYHAFLIGDSLMSQPDPAAALSALLRHEVSANI